MVYLLTSVFKVKMDKNSINNYAKNYLLYKKILMEESLLLLAIINYYKKL